MGIYAIDAARIRARSVGCRDNLRKIGLALSQYTETNRVLPTVTLVGPGMRLAHSPLALLVPLLPQANSSSQSSPEGAALIYDSSRPWFEQREGSAATVIPTFRCPASTHRDPVESLEAVRTHCPLGTRLATTDYIVCKGPNDSWCMDHGASTIPLRERGCFEIGVPLRPSDITDGLAQTIVMGEGAGGPQWPLTRMDRYQLALIDDETKQLLPAFSYWCWPFLNTFPEQRRTRVISASVFGTTAVELNKRPVIETIVNIRRLNDCRPRSKNGLQAVTSFRSDHVGGAYFLFADGASHFVNEGIVPDVYRALSSIAGCESVDYIN